jgi:two-component system NtrC family sensor kinase
MLGLLSLRPVPSTAANSSSYSAPVATAFGAIAEIATRIAVTGSLEDSVGGSLEVLRRALVADECAVWMRSADGLVRAWGAGTSAVRASDVDTAASDENTSASLATVPVRSGNRRLGILSVSAARPLTADERMLLAIVSDMLAPTLVHAEHTHLLEEEVALRTREIEQARRFTEKIIDSLPVGLYVIDREYRIHAWNRKRETGMQGVSREEAIGRTIFEILHRQPAEMLRREFDDVFHTGRIQQFQMESSATGDVRTFRISKIPMRINEGPVTHVITIGEDVTDWKEAEARFSQAEKLAAIGQLAAGVMHEINNPLATIAACAESLQMRFEDMAKAGMPGPKEATDYLSIVDNEVHRCKKIVDGLLDFARPKPVTKELVNVNDVIEKTLFLLKHHVRFKKVHVHTLLDQELTTFVYASPEQLVQVFMALLLNAMDAISDDGAIIVRTRKGRVASEAVLAEVIDDGHGIARGETSKIFEPFYTTKAPGRGTGLGLSICYGIITDHGGRVEVDSVPGKGSTFRVILPASDGV